MQNYRGFCRVYPSDAGDEVKVGVGGEDFFNPVVEHGGGMDGITGGDGRILFEQFQGLIGILNSYRHNFLAKIDQRGICQFAEELFFDGKIAIENFLKDLSIGNDQ